MLAVVFLVIHIVTAVMDTFVSIPLVSAVIPFTSGYEGFWLGLGAISLDIMLALIATSLVRGRLNRKVWRAVHWLAYASWPIAFAHSIGSSTDLQQGPLLVLAVACAVLIAGSLIWRIVAVTREVPRAQRVSTVMARSLVAGPWPGGSAGRGGPAKPAGGPSSVMGLRPRRQPPTAGRPVACRRRDVAEADRCLPIPRTLTADS